MRQKLRQEARRPSTQWHVRGATPRERRGDLVGAEPGPGPGRPRRAAVQRVQVCARRPGQPCRAGRHGRIPVGGHAGPLHRAVGADGTYLPGPAGGRGHHLAMRSRHRRGPDQASRPPPAGLGLENSAWSATTWATPPSPSLSISFQGWAAGSFRLRSPALAAGLAGCNHRPPWPPAARLWITGPTGCSRCTPGGNGVQPARGRGAISAGTGCSGCTRTVEETTQ
jgi:hypothetical protein